MQDKIKELSIKCSQAINSANDLKTLEEKRVNIFGKKGALTEVLKGMKDVASESRPIIGKLVNDARNELETLFERRKQDLLVAELSNKLNNEKIDISLPGKKMNIGHKHPMTIVLNEIKDIFLGLGYSIVDGPEIETDYYNFDALNIPEDHPAKDEQDTFYFNPKMMLRTATSPVQVRVMEKQKPPIRVIAPGRVFRSDAVDATHSPVFHQIEGLLIDENITMANLKAALEVFLKTLYGNDINVRFRPHFFPFTEPSAEVDVSCYKCSGQDRACKICRGSGYIEILGCGMVHPNVLKMSGLDPEKYNGFAFGMGLERLTMLRYGINDLRLFYENDIRFLQQF